MSGENESVAELLLDTDVLVDVLRGARRIALAEHHASYSVVTRCELFAGRNTDEGEVRALLAPLTEVTVNRAIAESAGRVRRRRGIQTADALIAATALERGLELVTRNRRHFDQIPGVRVRDPDDLAP